MALKDVIGQEKAVNILLRTIQKGRIPSSYLFAGESGIGKKFTALNLAKALNCLKNKKVTFYQEADHNLNQSVDACDECASCRKIDKGIYPDYLLIEPEGSQIRIDEIRAIDNFLSLKAFEGEKKIVIIDDAETMNQYAANAFLKTLEEPPEESLIMLISSNPDRLPDTIRSRCSRINFLPLSKEACKRVIETAIETGIVKLKTQKADAVKPAEVSAVDILARLSMGKPGIVLSRDLIEERTWFLNYLHRMLNAEKDGWSSREDMEKWFDHILILLRDMAVLKVSRDETNLINTDQKEILNKLSRSVDLNIIIESYSKLNLLKGYFNFNLNRSLTWNYTSTLLKKTMGNNA